MTPENMVISIIEHVIGIIEQKKQDAIKEKSTEEQFSPAWHFEDGKREALEDLEKTLESLKERFK